MDFAYSDEQAMLRDSVDRYGAAHWPAADRLATLAAGPEAAARRWQEMADLGWLMLPVAEADGGLGGGPVAVMAVAEGFGRHLITDPWISRCVLVPALLADGGDAAAVLSRAIGAGDALAAAALLEADSGYDLHRVATRAERTGDGWRLSGAKVQVEDGADAAFFVTSARTAGAADEADGISLFVIPADAPGLTVERFRAIDGHRHARLRLSGVTNATLVGDSDTALLRITTSVDRAICAQLAEATGAMEAVAATTLDYLKTRHQFGVPIGSFQTLKHRMVDITIACEEARAMTYHATLTGTARAVAAAKTRVGQCGLYVARQAVQLHGGVGTSDELIVSHHLKRQMMLDLAHGPADHHRTRFAALG